MPDSALVTGASSGIGEQFARQLAARGNDLILVARRRERLEALAESLPGTAHVVPCDLATEAGSLPGKVADLGLDVDLLVNNAGFGTYGRFAELDADREVEEVRVNCEAVVTLTHAFLPGMVERGWGRVVFVGSDAGRVGSRNEAVYAAAKGGVNAFCKSIAHEVARRGVTCNVVSPGPTETPRLARYREANPEKIAPLLRRIPIGRVGMPEDVAATAAFLCSDGAAYITGQVISVNGGLHMP
jgi:short-subunit dehydrogenase